MKPTISLLAFACLSLPLVACTDDPSPEPEPELEPSAELEPIACGRIGCALDLPVATGAKIAFVSTPAGVATSARTTDPTIATIAPGYNSASDAFTLTAIKAGTVTIELLDDAGEIVGTRDVTIVAPDRLEASITLTQGGNLTLLDRVVAEQPQPVPAAATALISVDPRIGDAPLLGWTEYELETTLTGGARVLQWDREGNALVALAAGDQAIEFKSSALVGRFVLAAR